MSQDPPSPPLQGAHACSPVISQSNCYGPWEADPDSDGKDGQSTKNVTEDTKTVRGATATAAGNTAGKPDAPVHWSRRAPTSTTRRDQEIHKATQPEGEPLPRSADDSDKTNGTPAVKQLPEAKYPNKLGAKLQLGGADDHEHQGGRVPRTTSPQAAVQGALSEDEHDVDDTARLANAATGPEQRAPARLHNAITASALPGSPAGLAAAHAGKLTGTPGEGSAASAAQLAGAITRQGGRLQHMVDTNKLLEEELLKTKSAEGNPDHAREPADAGKKDDLPHRPDDGVHRAPPPPPPEPPPAAAAGEAQSDSKLDKVGAESNKPGAIPFVTMVPFGDRRYHELEASKLPGFNSRSFNIWFTNSDVCREGGALGKHTYLHLVNKFRSYFPAHGVQAHELRFSVEDHHLMASLGITPDPEFEAMYHAHHKSGTPVVQEDASGVPEEQHELQQHDEASPRLDWSDHESEAEAEERHAHMDKFRTHIAGWSMEKMQEAISNHTNHTDEQLSELAAMQEAQAELHTSSSTLQPMDPGLLSALRASSERDELRARGGWVSDPDASLLTHEERVAEMRDHMRKNDGDTHSDTETWQRGLVNSREHQSVRASKSPSRSEFKPLISKSAFEDVHERARKAQQQAQEAVSTKGADPEHAARFYNAIHEVAGVSLATHDQAEAHSAKFIAHTPEYPAVLAAQQAASTTTAAAAAGYYASNSGKHVPVGSNDLHISGAVIDREEAGVKRDVRSLRSSMEYQERLKLQKHMREQADQGQQAAQQEHDVENARAKDTHHEAQQAHDGIVRTVSAVRLAAKEALAERRMREKLIDAKCLATRKKREAAEQEARTRDLAIHASELSIHAAQLAAHEREAADQEAATVDAYNAKCAAAREAHERTRAALHALDDHDHQVNRRQDRHGERDQELHLERLRKHGASESQVLKAQEQLQREARGAERHQERLHHSAVEQDKIAARRAAAKPPNLDDPPRPFENAQEERGWERTMEIRSANKGSRVYTHAELEANISPARRAENAALVAAQRQRLELRARQGELEQQLHQRVTRSSAVAQDRHLRAVREAQGVQFKDKTYNVAAQRLTEEYKSMSAHAQREYASLYAAKLEKYQQCEAKTIKREFPAESPVHSSPVQGGDDGGEHIVDRIIDEGVTVIGGRIIDDGVKIIDLINPSSDSESEDDGKPFPSRPLVKRRSTRKTPASTPASASSKRQHQGVTRRSEIDLSSPYEPGIRPDQLEQQQLARAMHETAMQAGTSLEQRQVEQAMRESEQTAREKQQKAVRPLDLPGHGIVQQPDAPPASTPAAAAQSEEQCIDFGAFSAIQLKLMCEIAGISKQGRKEQLMERLVEHAAHMSTTNSVDPREQAAAELDQARERDPSVHGVDGHAFQNYFKDGHDQHMTPINGPALSMTAMHTLPLSTQAYKQVREAAEQNERDDFTAKVTANTCEHCERLKYGGECKCVNQLGEPIHGGYDYIREEVDKNGHGKYNVIAKTIFQPPECDHVMWAHYQNGDVSIKQAVLCSMRFGPLDLGYRRHAHWLHERSWNDGDSTEICWPRWDARSRDFLSLQATALGLQPRGCNKEALIQMLSTYALPATQVLGAPDRMGIISVTEILSEIHLRHMRLQRIGEQLYITLSKIALSPGGRPRSMRPSMEDVGLMVSSILEHPDTNYIEDIAFEHMENAGKHLAHQISAINKAMCCSRLRPCTEMCQLRSPHTVYIDMDSADPELRAQANECRIIGEQLDKKHEQELAANELRQSKKPRQGTGQNSKALHAQQPEPQPVNASVHFGAADGGGGGEGEGEPGDKPEGKPVRKHSMRAHAMRELGGARHSLTPGGGDDDGSGSSSSENSDSDHSRKRSRRGKKKKKKKDSDSDTSSEESDYSDSDSESNDSNDDSDDAAGAARESHAGAAPDGGGSEPEDSSSDDASSDGSASSGGGSHKRKKKKPEPTPGDCDDLSTTSRLHEYIEAGKSLSTKDTKLTESQRFKIVCKELNRLARETATADQTSRDYAKHQRKALAASRAEAATLTYEELAGSKAKTMASKVRSRCKKIRAEMTSITRGCHEAISLILQRAYNVPLQRSTVADYRTLVELTAKDVKLHQHISTGDSCSERAYELVTILQTLCHQNPKQTWALIPVLARMGAEIKQRKRWAPTRLSKLHKRNSMFKNYPHLLEEYKLQTATLYDLFYKVDKLQTQKATKMLRFESPDGMNTVTVHGEKGDAVSLVNWWYQKHLKSGFTDEDSVLNSFLYSYSAFANGSLTKASGDMEDLIESAIRLDIKIPWARVITRTARVVGQRHTSFLRPMDKWEKHTGRHGEKKQSEKQCVNVLPTFYATIKALAETVQEKALQDHIATVRNGGRAFYTMHRNSLSGQTPKQENYEHRGGRGGKSNFHKNTSGKSHEKYASDTMKQDKTMSSIQCAGMGCNSFLPQGMVTKLNITLGSDGVCTTCFGKMIREPPFQIKLKSGGVRHKMQKDKSKGLTKNSKAYIAAGYCLFSQAAAENINKVVKPGRSLRTTMQDATAVNDAKDATAKEKKRAKNQKQRQKKAAKKKDAKLQQGSAFVTKADLLKLVTAASGDAKPKQEDPPVNEPTDASALKAWNLLMGGDSRQNGRSHMQRGTTFQAKSVELEDEFDEEQRLRAEYDASGEEQRLTAEYERVNSPVPGLWRKVPGATSPDQPGTIAEDFSPTTMSLRCTEPPLSPETTDADTLTTPVKDATVPTEARVFQALLEQEHAQARSMVCVSKPPAGKKYEFMENGTAYCEFMLDSASTDNVGSKVLEQYLAEKEESNLSVTGIKGTATRAACMGTLHLAAFDENIVGQLAIKPVHTLANNNANLISEWYLTNELGLHINKLGSKGVEVYRINDDGSRSYFPVCKYKGARSYMIRAIVGLDKAAVNRTACNIVKLIKSGKEWRWNGFGEEGFLTSPLQVAMWTRFSNGDEHSDTSLVQCHDDPSLKHEWVNRDSERKPTKREELFLNTPPTPEAGKEDWPSSKLSHAGRAFLAIAVTSELEPVRLSLAMAYGREAESITGKTNPGALHEVNCLEEGPDYGIAPHVVSCEIKDAFLSGSAYVGVGEHDAEPEPAMDITVPAPAPPPLPPRDFETPRTPDGETFNEIAEEIADTEEARVIYDGMDTNVLAPKHTAKGRKKDLEWYSWHTRLGHAGPGECNGVKCPICTLLKGKFHRLTVKRDPFKPMRPGFEFCTDMITLNVRSRHGSLYCMVTRCLCTGWYAPNLYLELRSDAPAAFEQMVIRLRADPFYKQLEYPIIQRLRHDQAGEYTGAKWNAVCKRLGIHSEITPAEDKRGSAHAEAAVKHIEIMMKSIMLQTLLPPTFWEEAAEQANFLRRHLPLNRNIISKDGDTMKPEEEITCGLVSRTACARLLAEVVPVGSPCLVYTDKIRGSNLRENKATWMMALGIYRGMNRFLNIVTGVTKYSKSFMVMQLPDNQNCYDLLRRTSPPRNNQNLTIEADYEENDIVVVIDELDAKFKGARPARKTQITRAHGTKVPQIIVMDKGSGRKYVPNDEHEIVPLLENDEEPGTVITTSQPEPSTRDFGVTQRERRIAQITQNPESIIGERLYKRFVAEADGEHLKDYMGVVQVVFITPGVGFMWKVMFEDHESEDFTLQQIIHHVVDGYVSLIGSDEPYKRTDKSYTESTVAHMRTPVGTLGGIADPYMRVLREDLNIEVDRDVTFTEIHIVRNAAGVLKVSKNMSWGKAMTEMGLPHLLRPLYKRWLGITFSPQAPAPQEGVLSCKFPTKWEGGKEKSRSWVKKDTRLPRPEGPSWVQWVQEFHRQRENAKPVDIDHEVRHALACAANAAHATHKAQIHDSLLSKSDDQLYYDVNPANISEPASANEAKRASAHSFITARSFKEYMGNRVGPKDLEQLTDKVTGQIKDPKNWSEIEKRPDIAEWRKAQKIEMDSIEEHQVFSQPMRLSEIRKSGVRTRPVDVGPIWSIKSDPSGNYDKHKCRYVLKGHPGALTQGINYWDTFSATPNAASERLLMFLVAQFGLLWAALDVSTAYLFGKVEVKERVTCRLAQENRTYDPVTGEELYRVLIGSLYGHPCAGLRWSERRDKYLLSGVFNNKWWSCRRCRYDAALFVFTIFALVCPATGKEVPSLKFSKKDIALGKFGKLGEYANLDKTLDGKHELRTYRLFCSVFTDDVSIVGHRQCDIDYLKDALRGEFGIKDCDPQHMLGLVREKKNDGKSVEITMSSYIDSVYEIFKADCPTRAPRTPLPPGTFLSTWKPETEGEPDADGHTKFPLYRKAVGCLLWIMRMARPEIACAVHMLCKMMSAPTIEAWTAAMHLIAYLHGTKNKGIQMTKCEGIPQLSTWYDASNKADQGSKGRTIGGFIVKIGESPLEWRSNNLTHCSQSAQHSEYQAMAMAAKATEWIRHLIRDLGFPQWVAAATPVLGDNNAAITLARNPILTVGNRFYTPDLHYSKERHEQGDQCYRKVPSEDNISDSLTKCTTTAIFERHVHMIMGYERQPDIPPAPSETPYQSRTTSSTSKSKSRMGG